MAYDVSQTILIARALARHGRNVQKTRAWLRTECETFRRIGINTLHRMLKNKKFNATVEAEYELWLAAERRGVAAATEEAARRAQESTVIAKIGRIESLIDATVKNFEARILNSKDISLTEQASLLKTFTTIIDRHKDRLLPVIAENKEGAFLVEATFEALLSKVGQAKTKEIMSAIGPLYEQKRKAAEQT